VTSSPLNVMAFPAAPNYKACESEDEVKALIKKLLTDKGPDGKTKVAAIDIETGYNGPDTPKRSLDPHHSFIVGISVSNDPTWARYVPVRHDAGKNVENGLELFRPLFEAAATGEIDLAAYQKKFERRHLRNEPQLKGCTIYIKFDVMLQTYVLADTERKGLKPVALAKMNLKMTEITDLFPGITSKQLDCIRFNVLELSPQVIAYACEDSSATIALHHLQYPAIPADRRTLYQIEEEISEYLEDMEGVDPDEGVLIDFGQLRVWNAKAKAFNQSQHTWILKQLGKLSGRPCAININSNPQLGKMLYETLGMKTSRKTKAGKLSTDAVALESLARTHPVVRRILEFREVQALQKRFLEKWPNEFAPGTGDIQWAHASVNQVSVNTGRFAVSDPPLQQCPGLRRFAINITDEQQAILDNPDHPEWQALWDSIPARDKFEANFRDVIIAPPGYYMLDFDYSQVELRVMAGLSGEQTLIDAFNNGDDVHTITAAMMLGIPADQVTPDQRQIGKTMNFALLYGMGAKSLSDRLAVSLERARELYDNYFSGFRSITTWMSRMKEAGVRDGYTTSWLGRRFTIWELRSGNPAMISKGERLCVNAPTQGGAADYMKVAMVRLARDLRKTGDWRTNYKPVMNNHDALTFYVSNDVPPAEAIRRIRAQVEFPVKGLPKIEAEFSIGQRWGSMTKSYKVGGVKKTLDENAPFAFVDGTWTVGNVAALSDEEMARWTETAGGTPTLPTQAATSSPPDPAPISSISNGTEQPTGSSSAKIGAVMQSAAVALADRPPPAGKTLIIEIDRMPDREEVLALSRLILDHPGNNPYLIKCPDGTIDGQRGTCLTPQDQGAISLAVGGARAYHPADDVDPDDLSGIEY
jgi:DNA polymerase-1